MATENIIYQVTSLKNLSMIGFKRSKKTFINMFLNFSSIFIKLEMIQQNSAKIIVLNFKPFNWVVLMLLYTDRQKDQARTFGAIYLNNNECT